MYTGITNNLKNRFNTHAAGKGSKYVNSRLPFGVVYIDEAENRSSASKREAGIKRLKRIDKLKLAREFDCDLLATLNVPKRYWHSKES